MQTRARRTSTIPLGLRFFFTAPAGTQSAVVRQHATFGAFAFDSELRAFFFARSFVVGSFGGQSSLSNRGTPAVK